MKPVACPECRDVGVIIAPELGDDRCTMKPGESYKAWSRRVQSYARYCECVTGQRIRFLHKKVEQLEKKTPLEVPNR